MGVGGLSIPRPVPGIREHCCGIGSNSLDRSGISISGSRHWSNSLVIVRGGRKSAARETVTSGRPLSREGIAVVQALKAARDDADHPEELERVFAARISRLLKRDLVEVFKELERQNECDLALKIFETMRREHWFKPELGLYRRLFSLLWDNNRVGDMAYVYDQVERDGMQPDAFVHREMMLAQLKHGDASAAMLLYRRAKPLGFRLNEKTFRIVISELRARGETELAAAVEEDLDREYPQHN